MFLTDTTAGIRKGLPSLTRGLGCPQKIFLYKMKRRTG